MAVAMPDKATRDEIRAALKNLVRRAEDLNDWSIGSLKQAAARFASADQLRWESGLADLGMAASRCGNDTLRNQIERMRAALNEQLYRASGPA